MTITIFNFNECNVSLSIKNCFKNKKDVHKDIIIEDLQNIICNSDLESEAIFRHLLNKCIQISSSEYGFIACYDKQSNKLKTITITNMAWDNASHEFYVSNHITHAMEFDLCQNNLFERCIKDQAPMIIKDYENMTRKSRLPPGHPRIKQFMAYPVCQNKSIRYIMGLANKIKKYSKHDVKILTEIMSVAKLSILPMYKNILIDMKSEFFQENSHQKTDYLKKKLVTPIPINNLGSNSDFSNGSNNISGIEIINSSRDNSQESSCFSVSSGDTYVLKNKSKIFYL